jgi:hypothetical protein
MSWRFNGMTVPNHISSSNFFVALAPAQRAAANRMSSAMFCDRWSVIRTRAFSSAVSASLAVTPCNRAGTMATTLGFTAFNICGGCLRARRRNEDCSAKESLARSQNLDLSDRRRRDGLCRVRKYWEMTDHSSSFLDGNRHAQKRCTFAARMDRSIL